MKLLLLCLIVALPLHGQTRPTYTQQNRSMEPLLASGTTYRYMPWADLPAGTPVMGLALVISKSPNPYSRVLVGLPGQPIYRSDSLFVKRAEGDGSHGHEVTRSGDVMRHYIHRNKSFGPTDHGHRAHLEANGFTIILSVPFSVIATAPVLADSMIYVHALRRPAFTGPGVRPHARGADSRELGPIHLRDVLGVILNQDGTLVRR